MNIEIDFKISDSAVEEFKKILSESGDQESLVRVVVQSGGCSGPTYGLGFVPPADVNPSLDIVGEFGGLKVVVDRSSLIALDGTLMEWSEESEEKGFKFTTKSSVPKKQCGCSRNK